jgi:hypothetical protein
MEDLEGQIGFGDLEMGKWPNWLGGSPNLDTGYSKELAIGHKIEGGNWLS